MTPEKENEISKLNISNDKLQDNEKLFIEISLTEYKELKSEMRAILSKQTSILVTTVVQFLTLFSLGISVINDSDFSASSIPLVIGIFYILIPCITMFFGIQWLDYVYRQITTASYLYIIERQINAFIHNDLDNYYFRGAMHWEHKMHKNQKYNIFINLNIWSYLSSAILYVFTPAMVIFIIHNAFKIPFNKWFLITVIIAIVYFIYIILCVIKMCLIHKNNP